MSRRPTRMAANRAIIAFLRNELGFVPEFTMVPDGSPGDGAKCGWAFWLGDDDTTSYVHNDLTIEWYGTAHGQEVSDER